MKILQNFSKFSVTQGLHVCFINELINSQSKVKGLSSIAVWKGSIQVSNILLYFV